MPPETAPGTRSAESISIEFARPDSTTTPTPQSSSDDTSGHSPAEAISITFANPNPEIPDPVGVADTPDATGAGRIAPSLQSPSGRQPSTRRPQQDGVRTSSSPGEKPQPGKARRKSSKSLGSILRCRISTYRGKRGRKLVRTIAETTKDIVGLASGGGLGLAKYWVGKLVPTLVEWGTDKLGYEQSKEWGDVTSALIETFLSAKTLQEHPDDLKEVVEGIYGTVFPTYDARKAAEKITGESSEVSSREALGGPEPEPAQAPMITPRVGDTI